MMLKKLPGHLGDPPGSILEVNMATRETRYIAYPGGSVRSSWHRHTDLRDFISNFRHNGWVDHHPGQDLEPSL